MWPVRDTSALTQEGLIEKWVYYVDGLCAMQILLGAGQRPFVRKGLIICEGGLTEYSEGGLIF
jgi:hypothetical protein